MSTTQTTTNIKTTPESDGVTQDLIVILDNSGSMSSMGKEPLEALNGFIAEQQVSGGESTFSLWMFDSNVRIIIDDVPLSDIKPITEYKPQNMTALNDAIGKAIMTKLAKTKNDNVVCLVITDGLENSSSMYTKKAIRDMIETCEKQKNWKFIFMGANQDVFQEGSAMGFNMNRCATYDQQTPGNLRRESHKVSDSVMQYRSSTLTSANPEHIELTLNYSPEKVDSFFGVSPFSVAPSAVAPSLGLRQKTSVEVISRRDMRQSPLLT